MMTAKENVIRTLRHDNPEWIPVNLWQLRRKTKIRTSA